jgi:NitT/TauT family transport system permease protein
MAVLDRDVTPAGSPGPSRNDRELAGLDALELTPTAKQSAGRRFWASVWPKVLAIVLVVGGWQLVVWSGWKPEFVLPSPFTVFDRLYHDLLLGTTWKAIRITLQRAIWGFAVSVVIGGLIGLAVSRYKPLRAAVGSLITGMSTMPSVVWVPLAILLFKFSESAILFVVVLGAAPSVANGVIHGVDHVQPMLLRAGRVLGARGLSFYRHVVIPAAMPDFVAGIKQGWAFAWRSLMAAELIVLVAGRPSVGFLLENNQSNNDAAGLLSMMLVVLVIGIVVDTLVFGRIERRIRAKRGLLESAG